MRIALTLLSALILAQDPGVDDLRYHVEGAESLVRGARHADARFELKAGWEVVGGLSEEELASPAIQALLRRLALAAEAANELDVDHDAWALVLAHRERTLPEDDLGLQDARRKLAMKKFARGDVAGAAQLFELVHRILSETLPDDHSELQSARNNLAIIRHSQGDPTAALALFEQAYEVYLRTLPEGHPELLLALGNLAAMRADVGDLETSLHLLERVVEAQEGALPAHHPQLLIARSNLADVRKQLGDLQGALADELRVLEAAEQAYPPDHPDLAGHRLSAALTLRLLEDYDGALELADGAFAVFDRTLPENDRRRLKALSYVADTLMERGEVEAALEIYEEIVPIQAGVLPEHHPERQLIHSSMAKAKAAQGDLAGAIELLEGVVSVYEASYPRNHPWPHGARTNLAWVHLRDGDVERAAELALVLADEARARMAEWAQAPRAAGATARGEASTLNLLAVCALGFGDLQPQPQLAESALLVSQAARGAETRTVRLTRRARSVDPDRASELESELRLATTELTALTADGTDAAAITAAVQRKERLQRQLVELARAAGGSADVGATAADLAARLPHDAAAAALFGYLHFDPERDGRLRPVHRLAAAVLRADGSVALRSLGLREEITRLVEVVRGGAASGRTRGEGLGTEADDDVLDAARLELRRRVVDPVLALAGEADTLYLAVDEVLELAPLDALPLGDGTSVGDTVSLRPLVSLFELLEEPHADAVEEPVLLVLGGVDYGPVGGDRTFEALPATMDEARDVAAYFASVFEDGTTYLVAGEAAGKVDVTERAQTAHFVHLATHGYFAGEPRRPESDAEGMIRRHEEATVSGLSPLLLTGLALTGANDARDELGRRPGILTAEEVLGLDLTGCRLVTLSACNTSLGVERAGQGYASLKTALAGAGARHVITSLWAVGDEATRELMADFYRRLWVDGEDPHAALWGARAAARERGAPFRDWAGWVLTGK